MLALQEVNFLEFVVEPELVQRERDHAHEGGLHETVKSAGHLD